MVRAWCRLGTLNANSHGHCLFLGHSLLKRGPVPWGAIFQHAKGRKEPRILREEVRVALALTQPRGHIKIA